MDPLSNGLPRPTSRTLLSSWLALLGLLLVAYAVVTLGSLGGSGFQDFFGRWVYDAVVIGAAMGVLARSILISTERTAWLALGVGLLLWALGQTYYSAFLYYASPAPFPSPSDALFLAFYPATYIALVLLLRTRVAHLDPLAWVDGLIGALAAAAVTAALIFPPVLSALGGRRLGVAVSLAYPCADLVLLGLIAGALVTSRWRAQGTWILIAAAIVLFGISDVVYLSVGGQSTQALNLASIGWPLAFLLLAAAAWSRGPAARSAPMRGGRLRIAIPISLALVVICLLALGTFAPIGAVAVGLGVACLIAVLARLAITFNQNMEILAASQEEAITDSLTGLGNRRRLTVELESALAHEPIEDQVLAIFDLDGFKNYNDSFGHPAGDDLLRRFSLQLSAAVEPFGSAYRLGGDEFCVLASTRSLKAEALCASAEAALSESGVGFSITASWGMVRIPSEAMTATEALRFADHRMYADKGQRADSARSQTRGVLLRVMHEREPALDRHLDSVARLAAAIAQALKLDAEERDVLIRAAELHDIGKVAIPDEILHKSAALSDSEWALMRKHPVIGERVLSAATAMSQVGQLVRSTHENWDGTGYPDGLSGEQIPLGSRIILICNAYEAMTEGRPYREVMSSQDAIEKLRGGAGSQFDPKLVELFAKRVKPALVTG
jgi:two-component system, cell cycle response regulator